MAGYFFNLESSYNRVFGVGGVNATESETHSGLYFLDLRMPPLFYLSSFVHAHLVGGSSHPRLP